MSNTADISKVVSELIKQLEAAQWARADRLQLVLNELVKVEVAIIEAGKL